MCLISIILIIIISFLFTSISSDTLNQASQAIESVTPDTAPLNIETVLAFTFSPEIQINQELLTIIQNDKSFIHKCNEMSAIDQANHKLFCSIHFIQVYDYKILYDSVLQLGVHVLVEDINIIDFTPLTTINSKTTEQTIMMTFNQKPIPKYDIHYITPTQSTTCFENESHPLVLACYMLFTEPGTYPIYVYDKQQKSIKVLQDDFAILSMTPEKVDISSVKQVITVEMTSNTPDINELEGFFHFGTQAADCKQLDNDENRSANKVFECSCIFDSVGAIRLFFGGMDSSKLVLVEDPYNRPENATDTGSSIEKNITVLLSILLIILL